MKLSRYFKKRIPVLVLLVCVTVLSYLIGYWRPDLLFVNVQTALAAVTTIYALILILLELFISNKVENAKNRYSLRRVSRAAFYLIAFIVVATIWVENTETLIASYAFVSAGVALALQDIFKNFFGGIGIYTTNLFQVGDRIEADGKVGDVLDIGLFYTTILEIKNWVKADQPTGRIIHIPNSKIIYAGVSNYTKDHQFIWDEISIPLTYDSDWKLARELIVQKAREVNADVIELADRQMARMGNRYYLEDRSIEPIGYIEVTDNWIDLQIRYVTDTFSRREIASKLQESFLEIIQTYENIELATESIVWLKGDEEGR